jgi:hypothetical protein
MASGISAYSRLASLGGFHIKPHQPAGGSASDVQYSRSSTACRVLADDPATAIPFAAAGLDNQTAWSKTGCGTKTKSLDCE